MTFNHWIAKLLEERGFIKNSSIISTFRIQREIIFILKIKLQLIVLDKLSHKRSQCQHFPKHKLLVGYRQPLWFRVNSKSNDKRRHLASWPVSTDSRGNESLLEAFTICILSSVQPWSCLHAKWLRMCRSSLWWSEAILAYALRVHLGRFWTPAYLFLFLSAFHAPLEGPNWTTTQILRAHLCGIHCHTVSLSLTFIHVSSWFPLLTFCCSHIGTSPHPVYSVSWSAPSWHPRI